MTIHDALSPIAQSANGIPSDAGGKREALTPDAQRILPNAEKLARFKQELTHHAALDSWIRIDGSQAIGVLEQGRFESRFAPLARVLVSEGGQRAESSVTNIPAEQMHTDTRINDVNTAAIRGTPGTTHERIGWRANLLAYDRTAILVSSAAMFASIRQSTLLISLDRMTRAMHSINFFSSQAMGLLFLPVHEGLLLNVRHDHGQYFAALLLSLRINPARVVIEIPGVFAAQTALLSQLVASYHRYGFKVAVNLPEGFNFAALPLSSKPEFLLTDGDLDQQAAEGAAQSAAESAARTAGQSALLSMAKFTRHYGATLVARATP